MRHILFFIIAMVLCAVQSTTARTVTSPSTPQLSVGSTNHKQSIRTHPKFLKKHFGMGGLTSKKRVNAFAVAGILLVLAGIFGVVAIPGAAVKMGILRIPLAFLSGLLATGAAYCSIRALRDIQKWPERWKGRALARIALFGALAVILTLFTYSVLLFSFL